MKLSKRCTVLVHCCYSCSSLDCNIVCNTTMFSFFHLLLVPKENNGISKRTLDPDRGLSTQDTESEVHPVTTVSPMNIPNHRPVLKGLLLHEHLLTRDFQEDQHFFKRDGSMAAYSSMPGSLAASNAEDPVTQLVPHKDAPAFSDIATTATVAATSPLTTFSPTTPRPTMSVPQKKSSKAKGADKVEPRTDPFTTQVTPNNRDSVASLSSQRIQPQIWSAPPVEATPAPSSMPMEEGGASEAMMKKKTSPDHPLPNLTSREEGATTTSKTVITTITTVQTAGKHVYISSDFHR